MSRLESEYKPRFEVAKEETVNSQKLTALPLHMRKKAIEEFDNETRLQQARELQSTKNTTHIEIVQQLANAQLLMKEKEYQLAANLFHSINQLEPKNEYAIRGYAECMSRLNNHEKAVDVLQKLLSTNKSPENYKLYADQLYLMGYSQDAIEAYFMAIEKGVQDGENLFLIYKNIGNIYLKSADVDAAEEYYNKAFTIHPDSDELLVNFGSLALYRGQYDKSLSRFREAAQKNPMNDKAWVGLAVIHREYGDLELSWANIENSLDINPNNEAAIKLVAEWALKDNEVEKAIVRLTKFLEENTQHAQIKMWLAKFLFFAGHMNSALTQIEQALKIEPNLVDGVEVLAVIRSEIYARESAIIPKNNRDIFDEK